MTRSGMSSWRDKLCRMVWAASLLLWGVTFQVHAQSTPAAAGATPTAPSSPSAGAMTLPMGKGLPVVVRTALYFAHLESLDDNTGRFEATTDLRLSWHDSRLSYPPGEGLNGYKQFLGAAADAQLAAMWVPGIKTLNRVGEASLTERRLRLYPEGRVELVIHSTALYKTQMDTARFPFDHQLLKVELAAPQDLPGAVDLDFRSDDVDFSRTAPDAELSGWELGLVSLQREVTQHWSGEQNAKVTAALQVQRLAGGSIATVFIPLFASLLIPFLATWMNKAEGGGFEVEAFELANVVIGGLFAVIALSFAISSAFPSIAAGDNTVTRLIGLNYVALGVALVIAVAFYRYKLLTYWFGGHVQGQAFRFLTWAFPLVFITTGLAFVAAAAA